MSRQPTKRPKGKGPSDTKTDDVRIDYRELRSLFMIAESQNITHAAEKYGVNSVTLHNNLKSLTKKVAKIRGPQEPLYTFNQEIRTIELTKLGETIYEHSRAAIKEIENIHTAIADIEAPDPSLRICATDALLDEGLFEHVNSVRQQIPGLNIDTFSRGSNGALTLLMEHKCHVAFVAQHTLREEKLAKRYGKREYGAYPIHLYVSETDFHKANRELRPYLEAVGQRNHEAVRRLLSWIVERFRLILPGDWSAFRIFIQTFYEDHGIPLGPNSYSEIDSTQSKLRAVGDNLGATLLWERSKTHIPNGVRRIALPGVFPDWRYFAVYQKSVLSDAAARFLETACPRKRGG
jgi:DNA-binding transcriptional LysR family regulator